MFNWLFGRKTIRISLNLEAFQALVRGVEVIVKDVNVKMILQDVGFLNMRDALSSAESGVWTYKSAVVTSDGDHE